MFDLSQWPLEDRRQIRGVFTDIDDTLTENGVISTQTLHALHRLKMAGLSVIAITGRSVGWSKPFSTEWPVDAIVAENGAVALIQTNTLYAQDEQTRAYNRTRMAQVIQAIAQALPHAHVSQDNAGRETDIAIDHSEYHQLSEADIARVVHIMQRHAMTATVSSIHINGWYGTHHKLEGARWIVHELLGRQLDAECDQWVYVGDSTNDERMFAHFSNSIGVANIRQYTHVLQHLPRYVTPSERGWGFIEVVNTLLSCHS